MDINVKNYPTMLLTSFTLNICVSLYCVTEAVCSAHPYSVGYVIILTKRYVGKLIKKLSWDYSVYIFFIS